METPKFVITSRHEKNTHNAAYSTQTVFCLKCYEAEITNEPLRESESVMETDASVACEHCRK